MAIRNLLKTFKGSQTPGEQPSAFYDASFSGNPDWARHYTASPYYIVWTVLIDRIRRRQSRRILEIGCGPGQLASAIDEAVDLQSYVGLDFSPVAIGLARKACPGLTFHCEDAMTTGLLSSVDYDLVVSTEFLEHVEADRAVIGRTRPGTAFLATVPNFPYVSHVRHFESPAAVAERYGEYFDDFSVVDIKASAQGKTFFVMEGRRR